MIPILMECSYSLLNAWAAQCSMLMFLWLTGLRTVCMFPNMFSLSYFCSLCSENSGCSQVCILTELLLFLELTALHMFPNV